jgi:hypothetical protein
MEIITHLPTSLKRNSHQLGTNSINRINEIPEKRDIAFTQELEIVAVDVRREESVRHISADVFECFYDFLDWFKEVYCDEFDTRVDPGVWEGSSGCDDDFGPFYVLIKSMKGITSFGFTYHSSLGCRTRCSMILKPLIPLAPVTKATFLVGGAPMFA